MYYDNTFLLLIPAFAFTLYAQWKVKSTYARYSKVMTAGGLTGSGIGRKLLNEAGLYDVPVEQIAGEMTDNYDPRSKTLRLSQGVYDSNSVAALGIAAHEVGHAMQDANAYFPLKIRNNIIPVANIGTNLAWPIFIAGMFMGLTPLLDIGIVLFSIAVMFTILTLPVEFNASNRAVKLLSSGGQLAPEEVSQARQVLNAAALTYVAAAAMALMNLLRLVALRNSRD